MPDSSRPWVSRSLAAVCRTPAVLALAAAGATLAVLAIAAPPTHAGHVPVNDPGRWKLIGNRQTPLYWYQGITSDAARNFFFDGIHVGLYRADAALNETGRNDDVIPASVKETEGYNHIGDISWDAREGGRVLLPLECYYPYQGAPANGNTCPSAPGGPNAANGTGSIGVADPCTLQWRYYVKLDPAHIKKAMWNEISPDGSLVWTQSTDAEGLPGQDLLAFGAAEIDRANAAPAGRKLTPTRRLSGAVPQSGITGAAFYGGSLLVAGQKGASANERKSFQVWSVDPQTGQATLEIDLGHIVGESEGIETVDALGGVLHWLILPYNEDRAPPTFMPFTQGRLLTFVPVGGEGAFGRQDPSGSPCATGAADPRPSSSESPKGSAAPRPGGRPRAGRSVRIRLSVRPRRAVAGRRTRFVLRATRGSRRTRRPVAGARIRFAGKRVATNRRGYASVVIRFGLPGRYRAYASRARMTTGYSPWVRVRGSGSSGRIP